MNRNTKLDEKHSDASRLARGRRIAAAHAKTPEGIRQAEVTAEFRAKWQHELSILEKEDGKKP